MLLCFKRVPRANSPTDKDMPLRHKTQQIKSLGARTGVAKRWEILWDC